MITPPLPSSMANQPFLTRELLQSMKRTDLQRVCKERGLKANLKTEAMIELLLDSSPPHSPRRPSRHRTVSTRAAGRLVSTRSRLHSTSSMIVHSDTDDDETQHTVKPESGAPSTFHPGPITRTRKAQDAQLRLGKGRPTVVGGQGARTVTRPVGIAKRVRSRSGRGAKPMQEPIAEESLITYRAGTTEEALLPQSNPETHQPQANENSTTRSTPRRDVSLSRALIEEQMQPLQRTITSLQKQLQQQASVHAREVATLNDKMMTVINELRELHRQTESIQLLRSSIEQLQSELSRLRQGRGSESIHEPTNAHAPRNIPPDRTSLLTNARPYRQLDPTRHRRTSRSSPVFEYPPPPAGSPVKPPSRDVTMQASNLGKRQRSRDTEGVSETDQEDTSDCLSALGRKRAKAEQSAENAPEVPIAGPSNMTVHMQTDDHTFADRPPSEIVPSRPPTTSSTTIPPRPPSGDRIVGGEIFTDQDFDFFDNPSNLLQSGSRPSSSQTAENQHPFTFAFPGLRRSPAPLTPAPTGSLADSSPTLPVLGSLPYPERPHSPSPAPMPYRAAVARPPHSESYRPFGFPPESSRNPLGGSPAPPGSAIDPATLLHTPPRQSPDITGPEVDPINGRQRASSHGLGMPARVEDTPAAPVRRTMYGTELDGDTRFGDFGLEGVATSYWAAGKF